jgi:hypothetical protein
MTTWRPPQPIEIDKKLRDDFRRLLKEYGVTTEETDPILAVLLRSVASQVAEVYEEAAETIPRAVLAELMAGLGMHEPRARAAQTIVRFTLKKGRELIEERAELIGETGEREKLTFALDATIAVSGAKIALAAIYQDGKLRLHHGTALAKDLEEARPSYEATTAALGKSPALYFAIDLEGDDFLDIHGLCFELAPEARDLGNYLKREVWCLLDAEGGVNAEGLLRPRDGNGGVRRLEWLLGGPEGSNGETYALPEGFYGGRAFILPEIPPERKFVSRIPRGMEEPLRKIFAQAKGKQDLFNQPRVWFRIGLPAKTTSVSEDLIRIVLHATTASNLETLNQTINFAEDGRTIPVATLNGRPRHLVKTLSIKGERGGEYLKEDEPSADESLGRYHFRQGNLEIEPARTPRGEMDAYANIRLLLSNGALGNQVGVGGIKSFLNRDTPRTLEIRNLTAAVGGDDGETVTELKNRFVETLLSRDRLVTFGDLEVMVRGFEPKIRRIKTTSALEPSPGGLQRVQRITIVFRREDFTAPEEETNVIRRELEQILQERSLMGITIRVAVEWMEAF